MVVNNRTNVSIKAKQARSMHRTGADRDGDSGVKVSMEKLAKGKYISTATQKVIEILDLDVRMMLESGRPRNGLVLYRYTDSNILRVAPRIWFIEIVKDLPRFIPYKLVNVQGEMKGG